MAKTSVNRLLPAIRRMLAELGARILLARLRRSLSQQQVSDRAGISRRTLREIERGAPGTSLGTLAAVLQVLGLENDIALLARDDELGRRLQDAELEHPARRVRRRKPVRSGVTPSQEPRK